MKGSLFGTCIWKPVTEGDEEMMPDALRSVNESLHGVAAQLYLKD